MDLVFLSLQRLMVSRYPGEDAFLGSREVGDFTQRRFSSCKGFSPSSSSPGGDTCFEETIRTFFRRLADSDKHLHSCCSRVRVRASVAICPLLLSMAVSLMVIWQWQSGRPTSPCLPESVRLLVQALSPRQACRFG